MHGAIRRPAVAGHFYPNDPDILRADLQSYSATTLPKVSAIGCLAPHAGYVYSGGVAGTVFSAIEIPRRCVVLCPNHTGHGVPLSIMSEGAWRTPLGEIPIDSSLADSLKRRFPALREDAEAHRSEHGIEVQLPFLQLRRDDLTFVPIALGTGQFEDLRLLGEALAETIAEENSPILVIASSDMNHYESERITRNKDRKAIDCMLTLNPAGLFQTVKREGISMCGVGPAVAMLTAAGRLGATRAELVKYATSGEVSGDFMSVVGYAGMITR